MGKIMIVFNLFIFMVLNIVSWKARGLLNVENF